MNHEYHLFNSNSEVRPNAASCAPQACSSPEATRLHTEVERFFRPYSAILNDWSDIVEWQFSLGPQSRAQCDALSKSMTSELLNDRAGIVIGAGLVPRPGLLTDAMHHLSWWLGPRNRVGLHAGQTATNRQLELAEDPLARTFHDFTRQEWWREPQQTGRLHVTGPYVDYICSEEYSLTLTMPFVVDGSFAGVVGLDLFIRSIEQQLLPAMRSASRPTMLVNSSGRIICSTVSRFNSGELISELETRAAPTCSTNNDGPKYESVGLGDSTPSLQIGNGPRKRLFSAMKWRDLPFTLLVAAE